MKKTGFLFILMWFLSHVSFAQIELKGTWDGSDGSHPQSSYDGGSFRPDLSLDRKPSTNHDRDRGGNSSSSENTYSGPDFIGSWGGNLRNSDVAYYITERNTQRWKKDNTEAMSILQELNDLLSNDCIDIHLLQNVYVRFNSLSSYQRSILGYEGDEAFAELTARLNNARPYYEKYSKMALDIKNNSFSKIDKDVMHKPYEELNGYLRQFLSKEEFDRAKIEYEKYEKDETVKKVYEKTRHHEVQEKTNKAREDNNHLALQKIREKKKHYPSYITINNWRSNGTAVSGGWEEASIEVIEKAMDKFFKPIKEHVYNIDFGFTGLTKRMVNFSNTQSSNVFGIWDADKKVFQAVLRGENAEHYLIKEQHKVMDRTYNGIIESF